MDHFEVITDALTGQSKVRQYTQSEIAGRGPANLLTRTEQGPRRQAAFAAEADPLFFQWQAGEATEAEWLAKRQEIRDRYPYPAE